MELSVYLTDSDFHDTQVEDAILSPLGLAINPCSGRILEIGSRVNGDLAVGRRVILQPQISCGSCLACRSGQANICPKMEIVGIERASGFADFVSVSSNRIFPLPENVSDAEGTLVETLAVEVRLFRTMAQPLLRTVAVWGAGASDWTKVVLRV